MNSALDKMGCVTLPVAAFTTESLAETAARLLEHLARSTPGAFAGRLCLAEESPASLRSVAAFGPRMEAGGDQSAEADKPSAEELRLLYRAFCEASLLVLSAPVEADTAAPQTAPERPTSLVPITTLALPLTARHGVMGAILLHCLAPEPGEAERTRLEAAAQAIGFLLNDLIREERFRELERSKQHWQATFDSLEDLLYIHDAAGALLKINRALAERMGVQARELMLRRDLFSQHFPVDCAAADAPRARVWRSTTLDATFEMTHTPVYDRDNRLIGCVHILRDITERLRLEAQIRQNERLAALGEMVSGIAHELNNPLTSIVGYSERLSLLNAQAHGLSDQAADYVRKIGLEADRAAHIVRDLLACVRPQTAEMLPLTLNETILETAELCADRLHKEQVRLHLKLDSDAPPIRGNRRSLQQVLFNLITNAVQAIRSRRAEGNITISATPTAQGGVCLIVADDGPGIPPEIRERLPDPFFTTKPAGEGTGLGLSICHTVLRAHDAVLEIESEYGRGASFRMTFPPLPKTEMMNRETAGANQGLSGEATKPAPPAAPLAPMHIAVLDDEPFIRSLFEEMLIEQGHRVECFATPPALLEALRFCVYDVILSDIKMKEMSGIAFYERVRENNPAQAQRILFLTGDAPAPATQAFLARTGRLYLNKPFKLAALTEKIDELLQHLAQTPQEAQAA